MLEALLRVRRFEERCVKLYSAAKIRGFIHLHIGEEAVAVGVNEALTADDAVVSTYRKHSHALTNLAMRAASYGMPAWSVDGMDVEAVEQTARRAAEGVRAGTGPLFLGLRTYRFRAHSMYDPGRQLAAPVPPLPLGSRPRAAAPSRG
ncbi:hypothetical protein ITI46_02120 [Streptomyces oryzae]|uniref:Dehydrogenase E1 component domain-containing protein n=1 Tax=Streptomyces oryzae TaxID=1434886 RepID=A0ABS3X568_9ACTN|nr:hypothetical protein [Streptomyces oryzae]